MAALRDCFLLPEHLKIVIQLIYDDFLAVAQDGESSAEDYRRALVNIWHLCLTSRWMPDVAGGPVGLAMMVLLGKKREWQVQRVLRLAHGLRCFRDAPEQQLKFSAVQCSWLSTLASLDPAWLVHPHAAVPKVLEHPRRSGFTTVMIALVKYAVSTGLLHGDDILIVSISNRVVRQLTWELGNIQVNHRRYTGKPTHPPYSAPLVIYDVAHFTRDKLPTAPSATSFIIM